MARHNISYAENLYAGAAYYERFNAQKGLPADLPIYYDFGAIATHDRDGLVTSVDPASGATLTLRSTVTGMTNSGGVVTLDTPRNVTLYSAADQSTKNILVTGTDLYGAAMTESITGPDGTSATKLTQGNKAFKTISSIVATGDFGTIEVGFGSKIGLPYRVTDKNQVIPRADGRTRSPYVLTSTITAVGTAQDTAVISPFGGIITRVSGVSAANNGTASSIVTVTNATLEVAVLTFTSSYSALTAVTDSTLLNTRLSVNDVLKVVTDGGGDGAGQATVSITIEQAIITIADDTTATTTTGDVRGTIDFGYAPDGTLKFGAVIFPVDRSSGTNSFGITQA